MKIALIFISMNKLRCDDVCHFPGTQLSKVNSFKIHIPLTSQKFKIKMYFNAFTFNMNLTSVAPEIKKFHNAIFMPCN